MIAELIDTVFAEQNEASEIEEVDSEPCETDGAEPAAATYKVVYDSHSFLLQLLLEYK